MSATLGFALHTPTYLCIQYSVACNAIKGTKHIKRFSCQDHFRCLAFAQLTYRESLRDIEACLSAQRSKLYHMGIRAGKISHSTLADANEQRDWRIYADFAQALITLAKQLYSDDDLGVDFNNTVYALDTTTIDLSLSMFPWAHFRRTKAAVKLHTLLDLRGNIPAFVHISDGKCHEVNVLDLLIPDPGAFYVMDRGFIDFQRLYHLSQSNAYFLIRAKSNIHLHRVYSYPVDKDLGLRCDQAVLLNGFYAKQHYPKKLRRIEVYDADEQRTLVLLTNHFSLAALTITELYRYRWQVTLFFKWIKQHLRIKAFYGTSENAVKTKLWVAVSVYVLIAIIKKRMQLDISLYTILQLLSLTVFEKIPLNTLFQQTQYNNDNQINTKQLNLFD